MTVGFWIIPTFVTIIAFLLAAYGVKGNGPGRYGEGVVIDLLAYFAATVVSLIAFLIWALLT